MPLKSRFSSNFTSVDNSFNFFLLDFKLIKKKKEKMKVTFDFVDADRYPNLPHQHAT